MVWIKVDASQIIRIHGDVLGIVALFFQAADSLYLRAHTLFQPHKGAAQKFPRPRVIKTRRLHHFRRGHHVEPPHLSSCQVTRGHLFYLLRCVIAASRQVENVVFSFDDFRQLTDSQEQIVFFDGAGVSQSQPPDLTDGLWFVTTPGTPGIYIDLYAWSIFP